MRNCQKTESNAGEGRRSVATPDRSKLLRKDPAGEALLLSEDPKLSKSNKQEHDTQKLSMDAEEKILALYDEYRPRLFRYIRSMQLSRDLAEEVIQETFMRLTIELTRENSIENAQGWIVRVAHNLAVNLLKREQRPVLAADAPAFVIENHVDPALRPDETYSKNEQVRLMKSALAVLKPQHRQCFEMRVQGFAYKDISLALGISEQRAAFVVKQVAVRLAAICG